MAGAARTEDLDRDTLVARLNAFRFAMILDVFAAAICLAAGSFAMEEGKWIIAAAAFGLAALFLLGLSGVVWYYRRARSLLDASES